MFKHFRQQAEALIEAVTKNTEELQSLKAQVRGIHGQAQNLTEILSTPPKVDASGLEHRLDQITALLTDLLKVETKREKRQGY